MKLILEKLGQDPQHSLTLFMRGLGLFVIGVICIVIGYFTHHIWQIVGIVFLAVGVLVAAYGYIGIFSNRLLNVSYKLKNLQHTQRPKSILPNDNEIQ